MKLYDPTNWCWQVGQDETRYWSSKEAQYVPADGATYQDWRRAGGIATRVPDGETLWEVLMQQYPAGLPPPASWSVPLPLFRQRLEAVEKWDAVAAALTASPSLLLKVLTLEQGVPHDDPEILELLSSAGADAAVILARP